LNLFSALKKIVNLTIQKKQIHLKKHRLILLLFTLFLCSYATLKKQQTLHFIPEQTLNLFHLIGDTTNERHTVSAFEISKMVTYKEYKVYLNAVKKDSNEAFYISQLPDSNIGSPEIHKTYLNSTVFDESPVIGISWDNAMNYCKWMTINLAENKDSLNYIIRLPSCSEWLASYHYFSDKKIQHDMNNQFSDWLINMKDESIYEYNLSLPEKLFIFDYCYFHNKNDHPALRRKTVIGNSFLFQQDEFFNYNFNYLSNLGYKNVGFRYVKQLIEDSPKMILTRGYISFNILKLWGILN